VSSVLALFLFANANNLKVRKLVRVQYQLIDGQLLSRLMRCPEPDGTRHTLRSLAQASGLSKSKVAHMVHGRRPLVSKEQAAAIAAAVGVRREAVFRARCVCIREHEQPEEN
jgi:hypothetical protein